MKSCRLAEEAPGEAASGGGSQPTDLAARYVLRTLFFQAMQRVSFALGKWGAEEVWIDLHTCHLNLEQIVPIADRTTIVQSNWSLRRGSKLPTCHMGIGLQDY